MSQETHIESSVPAATDAPLWKRILLGTASLAVAAAIWLPCLHFFFRPPLPAPQSAAEVQPLADRLTSQQLYLWTDAASRERELAKMRGTNAEWDFMGRTFLVLALANRAVRHPEQKGVCLEVIDRIIDETLKVEEEKGIYHFLMPYARNRHFVAQPPRSLFIDGEIALMLAARRTVAEKDDYREPLRRRVDEMVRRMEAGPVLCAESYPDECWMFCNTAALAAIRLSDRLDGTDHDAFFRKWIATAKAKLVDPKTGILVSSFTLDGQPHDGPEGSSIWMSAHCLQIVDADFAADQYRRARKELGRDILGFGFAREWPATWVGQQDVDSGPVVPLLGVSAGSSGLALLGSRSFDDDEYFRELQTTMDFAAFPTEREGRLRYCASNQVGDAVMLYAASLGPLWQKVRSKAESRKP
jgi:hypothetical protein